MVLRSDLDLPFLNADSVVLEAGAYRGDWTCAVAEKYHCTVHAFEPATFAFGYLRDGVADMKNVYTYPVALWSDDGQLELHDCKRDGASIYATIGASETVQCVDVSKVVSEIGHIDLAHLNMEGAETTVLERLVETSMITSIDRIMVQWHLVPGIKIGQSAKLLLPTHIRTHEYREWEMYRIKEVQ